VINSNPEFFILDWLCKESRTKEVAIFSTWS